jgi:hypothetical protein
MDIGVSYVNRFEAEPFDEFARSIQAPTLRTETEARELEEFRAGIEWLLTTAAFVFITKSYFGSFLKEMGKDHYTILKNALKLLTGKVLGRFGPRLTPIGSAGKVRKDDPYSLASSLYVDLGEVKKAKLLFQHNMKPEDIDKAVETFGDLILALQDSAPSAWPPTVADAKWACRTLLVAYDSESGGLKTLDPMEKAQQVNARDLR